MTPRTWTLRRDILCFLIGAAIGGAALLAIPVADRAAGRTAAVAAMPAH